MNNRPIADSFFKMVSSFPLKTAIICGDNQISYKDFGILVNKYSNFLLHHGVKRNDHIGVPMLNDITSVALLMAANNIGVGLVPINPSTPLNFVEKSFSSGDIKHLVAHSAFLRRMDMEGGLKVSGLTICTDGSFQDAMSFDSILKESSERPICNDVTGDETLVLIMTSGSTGDPKPINLTQNCKFIRAMGHINLYKLTNNDIILAATPLYHTLAVRLVMLPLILGGTSVILQRYTPMEWLQCIHDYHVTFTIAVSSQLAQVSELLEDKGIPDITSLRCLVSSSAWLEPQVKQKIIKSLKCDFHEIYGTSETASPTDIDFRESVNKQKSVGRCVSGAKIKIMRSNGTEAEKGEIGEITVNTNQLFEGYYKRPDLTKQSFYGQYFRTGDLGYMDSDGYLYFSGRLKEVIISGGINVYPQDIEATLLKNKDIKECAAFSYEDKQLGEVVGVVVVPEKDKTITNRDISIYCAKHLADFQQPRHIFIVKEIPKNNMGKISRLMLKSHFH